MNAQSFTLATIGPLTIKNQIKRETILNGSTASQQKYPYATSLQYGSRHFCGGSLIAPDIVLSAAHCFDSLAALGLNHDYDRLEVIVGEHHFQDLDDGGEKFSVESMHIHPGFKQTREYLENDAVIVKLSGQSPNKLVRLNRDATLFGVEHAANELKANIATNKDHHEFTVLGWGSLDAHGNIYANVLQEVNLGYINNDECMKRGLPVITSHMICAVDLDNDGITEDSCYGDSGGPLIMANSYGTNHKRDIQVGIVSFGSKICGTYPGVYTRISSVFDWIRDTVCELSMNAPNYFHCNDATPAKSRVPTKSPNDIPTSSPSSNPIQIHVKNQTVDEFLTVSSPSIKETDIPSITIMGPTRMSGHPTQTLVNSPADENSMEIDTATLELLAVEDDHQDQKKGSYARNETDPVSDEMGASTTTTTTSIGGPTEASDDDKTSTASGHHIVVSQSLLHIWCLLFFYCFKS